MARAIKSILANRKLFQGGGLVPPGNPMQNLNQANGILASSQPLIDSVVSDAVNPQGGRTLSMDSGGIAKFQFGGLGAMDTDLPSMAQLAGSEQLGAIEPLQQSALRDIARVQQARQAFENKQITREQLNKVQDEVIAKYGSVENLERLLPRDVSADISVAEAPVQLTSPTSALPPIPFQAVEELQPPPTPQVISEQILEEKIPEVAVPEAQAPADLTMQLATESPVPSEILMADNVRTPIIESQIEPAVEPAALKEKVPIVEKPGTGKRFFKKMLPDETIGAWLDRYNKLGTPEKHDPAADYGLWTEDQNAVWVPRTSLSSQEATDQMKKERWLEKHPNMTSAEYDAQLNNLPGKEEAVAEVIDTKAPTWPGPEGDTFVDVTSANNTETGTITAQDLITTYGVEKRYAVEMAALMNSKGLSLEDAAQQVATNNPTSVELATKGRTPADESIDVEIDAKYSPNPIFDVQVAHDEFVGMMPDYESKTGGYNWMLMGLAIAAGTSPDAITNISQGALKALPSFIEDEKEREKYLRSMNMAGTRYALTKRDTLAAEERQAERVMNNYWVERDIIFRNDAGDIVEQFRGPQFNRLNDRQVQAIQEHTGLALMPEDAWIADAKAMRDAAAANPMYEKTSSPYKLTWFGTEDELQVTIPTAAGKMEGLFPVLQYEQKLIGAYEGSTARVQSMQALASAAREQLNRSGWGEEVAGFSSILSRGKDVVKAWFVDESGAALEGVNPATAEYFNTEIATPEQIAAAGSEGVGAANSYDQYLRLLAIQMAPLLLGESGKTISNQDRKLVATALGMAEIGDTGQFRWIGSSLTSEAQLHQRLDQLDLYLRKTQQSVDNLYFRTWKEFGVTPTRLVSEEEYAQVTPSAIQERTPESPVAPAFKLILGEDGVYESG